MRKFRIMFLVVLIILSVLTYLSYKIIYSQVDITYVDKLEKALNSYDISLLDNILSNNTEICYKNETRNYEVCREKIYEHMKNRDFDLTIYGGSDNIFKNNILKINTQFYGNIKGKNYGENTMTVYLKQVGLYSFKIIKLESNDDILIELFY